MKPFIIKSSTSNKPSVLVLFVFLFVGLAANAQEHDSKMPMKQHDHIMIKPDNVKWADGPGSLPAGAKFSVIEGDPKVAGLFTMRLWFPAGYKIAAHWHPADEHITVISGTFLMGMGDQFNEEKLQSLPVGSFAVMITGSKHFAMAKEETVVQLHGMGPWGINYVNPADDPRKK